MTYEVRLAPGAIEALMDEKDLLTFREFSRMIDIAPSQLSQIMTGNRRLSASFIAGVFKAYGYGIDHKTYIISRKVEEIATPRLVMRQPERQPVRHVQQPGYTYRGR